MRLASVTIPSGVAVILLLALASPAGAQQPAPPGSSPLPTGTPRPTPLPTPVCRDAAGAPGPCPTPTPDPPLFTVPARQSVVRQVGPAVVTYVNQSDFDVSVEGQRLSSPSGTPGRSYGCSDSESDITYP